jgi:Protease inhibitor Inh
MRDQSEGATKTVAIVLVLGALTACTNTERFGGPPLDQAAATPPPPAPSAAPGPPPVDLAGKWKLSAAGGASCVTTFGSNPATTTDGPIAPAGGCPGNFFTSRKWSYEHDRLIIRNHKGDVLVELSFADGRFTGQAIGGPTITLSR